ncbi:MAG: TetR/AcrR family transcriptional regulator [Terriglobia bacterium]
MKGNTTDRRVRKTQTVLHQALMSLVLEKKYESITVQDILDRADVGRSTFYVHYQNKDELLAAGLEHLKSLLNAAQSSSAPPGRLFERIIGFSRPMFEHSSGRRELLRSLLSSSAEPVVRREIHSVLAAVVHQEVEREFRRRKRTNWPISPELLTHSLVSTYISMLTWWLNSKNPVSPEDMDAAYRHLFLPCLASIFG